MKRFARLYWVSLPRRVARWSRLMGAALEDGHEVRAWPTAALGAPLVALAVGVLAATTRQVGNDTFAASFPQLIALVAVSAFGANLGLMAFLGYVVGDLLIYRHFWVVPDLIGHLANERLPQFITYGLLFMLIVLLPLAVTSLRRRTLARLGERTSRLLEPAVQAALGAAAGVAATASLPMLLPIFDKWVTGGGDLTAVLTIRGGAVAIVAVLAIGGAVRVLVEQQARPRIDPLPAPEDVGQPSARARVIRLLLGGFAGTLLLAAILDSVLEAGLLFGALVAALVLRTEILPRWPAYVRLVARVPMLLRIVATVASAYVIGLVVMTLRLSISRTCRS